MVWSVGAGLEDKGVIVTGAAGGIGKAVAKAFATAGARVMICDRDRAAIDSVLTELEGKGHSGMVIDIADRSAQDELISRTQSELGNLYALAHLAAVLQRRPSLVEVTEDDWDQQIDTNLKATFFLCRSAAEAMKAQGNGGRIIAFTSQAWWTGSFGGGAAYAASKGGVVSLMRSFARSYGAYSITINTVAPGQVNTPMLMTGLESEVLRTMTDATPLKRVAEPEEMAGTAVFLASKHASFITGATINASGGFLMY